MAGAAQDANAGTWRVLRLDDNGNEFVVATGLSQADAQRLVEDYEGRGHKQTYWMQRQ